MSIMRRCAGALYLDSGIFFESGVSEHFRFGGICVAYKRSSDEIFIKGTIKTVAQIGIENMRTKHVADYAGFTEATMYRRFPSKEILLREAFLSVDEKVSSILTQSAFIRNPDDTPFELAIYAIWHKVFRYLIEHREETIFLIRYRYSSLYTEEVRKMRQAYNGGFDRAYGVFEKCFGKTEHSYRGFLINYIFEMTLGFAEKIITGKIEDDKDTEERIWLAVSSAVKSWTPQQEAVIEDDQDYCFPAKGANSKCIKINQEHIGLTQ